MNYTLMLLRVKNLTVSVCKVPVWMPSKLIKNNNSGACTKSHLILLKPVGQFSAFHYVQKATFSALFVTSEEKHIQKPFKISFNVGRFCVPVRLLC